MIMKDNYTILIPARKGSKGIPFKNRILFCDTAKIIPNSLKSDTYVSTNDDFIMDLCKVYDLNVHKRTEESSQDRATSKDFVLDFIKKSKDYLITLYLTYPERTWDDVQRAISFFNEMVANSLLCKKKLKVSPYLMMYDLGDGKGRQIIHHDLCRRQDYKPCFEISHFVSIIKKSELSKLNNNLYNEDTIFYPICDKIDIDTLQDLEKYNEKN